MFWGLIMEPGRCYTQTVKVPFHVSMAALDVCNSSTGPAQVMCVFEGRNYLLCTLNNNDKLQCPLDLNFEVGSKVSFATNGKSHVHLTGYLTAMEDEIEEEEVDEDEVEKVANKKEKKRPKKELTEGPPKKKSKTVKNDKIANSNEEVEEEEDDSDFDVNELMSEDKLDDDDDENGEEEEVDEEESDDEAGEEASSLSEEEDESEEQDETTAPKQNGVTKSNATSNKKKKEQEKVPKSPKSPKIKQEVSDSEKKEQQKAAKSKKTTLKGGVMIQDLKEGSGEVAKAGKFVHVYYEGRLKDTNKMFDSTTKGPGFSFRVGKGEVIKGWDIGLVGMKVGGKRRIICPPNTAYGAKGSPPVIPPNSTLVFEVELKKVS